MYSSPEVRTDGGFNAHYKTKKKKKHQSPANTSSVWKHSSRVFMFANINNNVICYTKALLMSLLGINFPPAVSADSS